MHTGHPKHPLKETLKADVPAYHFVVIIFSKHSPGLADKLQTQHSRWALSLSLSLPSLLPWNSVFFLSVRLLPHSVSGGRMTGRRRTGGGGERKTRWHSGVKVMTLNVRKLGTGAHTHWHAKTQIHTHTQSAPSVPVCSRCFSTLAKSNIYMAFHNGRYTPTGEGQHLRGQKGITSIWLSLTRLKRVVCIIQRWRTYTHALLK